MKKDSDIVLNNEMKKKVIEIYSKIFCCFKRQHIIVFLCRGASTKSKKSLRDKVRVLLEVMIMVLKGEQGENCQ